MRTNRVSLAVRRILLGTMAGCAVASPLLAADAAETDSEEIVVTDHGKPVARLVPMNGERKIDRLIREGVVIPARSRTGWRPETLIPVEGSVSEIVIEQRG